MHIYLDESGGFIPGSTNPNSWCVVAGFALPEAHRRRAEEALSRLKCRVGHRSTGEIKLRDIAHERQFLAFLCELDELAGTLYACATDTSVNSHAAVRSHLARQVEKLVEHLPKMKHDRARQGLQDRADRFAALSPQLYLQIMCQYSLLSRILRQGVLYYAQRIPATLARFRWRVDRKNQLNSVFDESFRDFAAPILQTMSFEDPLPMLVDADYRHFDRFRYVDGPPKYLKDTYGLDVGDGFNITQVMREDFEFVDSKASPGVQIVDLLVSGLRRCLRGEFRNNLAVADALGGLIVQAPQGELPVELLSLDQAKTLDRTAPADQAIRAMHRRSRSMRLC